MISNTNNILSHRLQIKGRVQGVGFRPFIYRLANQLGLKGQVYNQPDGVIVYIEGKSDSLEKFLSAIKADCPPAAIVKEILREDTIRKDYSDFTIGSSNSNSAIITEICPDIALCDDCLTELFTVNRRKAYPLINCTNCGPRFTLIEAFPYDRKNTSMHEFEMCPDCKLEYNNPSDRRFHAQPISCFTCGPHYQYHSKNKVHTDPAQIFGLMAESLGRDEVIAMKGLGGYNLVCDAFKKNAVEQIRHFKNRERKPFAVMFRSLSQIEKIARLSTLEKTVLHSWQRPILILEKIDSSAFPSSVTSGLNSIGAFLPYLPLHHLLFDKVHTDALVITSGNESDVPILYEEEKALKYFRNISGGILINNRKIVRRADDSVVKVIADKPMLIRRSRGYAPAPIELNFKVDGILATGAELSNAFAIGKDKTAILSQHIGDLKNIDTYDFYRENISEFSRIYLFNPRLIACDLHPNYLSSQYAKGVQVAVTEVQHHHAHIAGVMAEHGLNNKVLGLAYDGTGYGADGNIWGSELLVADYRGFERRAHYEYLPLPGGDNVTKEPWRTGLSLLYKYYGNGWKALPFPLNNSIDLQKAELLTEAIDKKINCPLSCSAGRLFDALAAILGICTESHYHAEAPLLLENFLDERIADHYPWKGEKTISFKPMFDAILKEHRVKIPFSSMVTKFHNTIAQLAFIQLKQARSDTGLNQVVLSGGSFQNRYLTEKLVHLLNRNEFDVYLPQQASCNDGGIALGQMAIAAHKI